MSRTAHFADFFSQSDYSKLIGHYHPSPFDMKVLLDAQRKNMQALTEASQRAAEGLQDAAQRQAEILSRIMEDQAIIAQEMMSEGSPEEKIARNAQIFKTVYEHTVDSLQEMSAMLTRSSQEASKIVNRRVTATMNEIQSSLEKNSKKAA